MQPLIARILITLVIAAFGIVHAQSGLSILYTVDSKGWQRNSTPTGEVFTCSVCETQVQVQIDVGPQLGLDAKFKTNEQFLAQLSAPEQQKKFADGMLRSQIPLQSNLSIRIERVGLTKIGGQEAFQFMAVVELKPTTTRDTTMFLIYKNRPVKISINYYDGTFSKKAQGALKALLTSLKFV